MRTYRKRISLSVLMVVCGSIATAQGPTEPLLSSEYYYYSDGTFTTEVGGVVNNQDCDEALDYSWGTTSDYREFYRVNCRTGGAACNCQQYINGTWQLIECPAGICSP